MKNTVLVVVAAAVLVGLSLLAYEYAVVQPRDRELRATVEQIKQQTSPVAHRAMVEADLAAARETSRAIAADLEAANKKIIADNERSAEQQKAQQIRVNLLADAFTRAQMHKVAVVEYYQTNLQWPNASSDIGLANPSAFAGQAVTSIGVEKNGVIRIRLNKNLADGASVLLIPNANPQTYQVEWRCDAKELAALDLKLQGCDH